MKAIVHIVRRDGPVKKRVAYLANKAVLLGDWLGNGVDVNAELLMEAHHGGRGRKTRHLIISLEQGGDLPSERLAAAAERFVAEFAPSSAWLGAIDRDTRAVHVHLLLVNSDGERCLDFSPSVLQRMQDAATWSGGLLETGRRGAILAKLTIAKKIREMTYEQIQNAIETGTLTVGRRSKLGLVSSVVYAGRRVRLSTVQRAGPSLGGDPAHRHADISTVGVVGNVDTQRERRAAAARRGTRGSAGKGQMGAAPALGPGHTGITAPAQRREPSELFPARPRPLQRQTPFPGDNRVDCNPQMGGRVR